MHNGVLNFSRRGGQVDRFEMFSAQQHYSLALWHLGLLSNDRFLAFCAVESQEAKAQTLKNLKPRGSSASAGHPASSRTPPHLEVHRSSGMHTDFEQRRKSR